MKTVLFVDANLKDVQIFFIMNQIFMKEALKLVAAFDAADAASKAAASSPPDVILIKYASDTLDILKRNKASTNIPAIVLLPKGSSANYQQKMKDAGAIDAVNMDQFSILQIIDKARAILG